MSRRGNRVSLGTPLESALATVLGVERSPRAHHSRRGRGIAAVAPGHGHVASAAIDRIPGRYESRAPPCRRPPKSWWNGSRPLIPGRHVQRGPARSTRSGCATIGDLLLRPALSRVRGVGRIEVLGGDVREIEVVVDPERAAALHLRPTDITERVRASTVLQAVGPIRGVARARDRSWSSAEPRALADLERIPVATAPDGSPVPLSRSGAFLRRRRRPSATA